MNFIGEKFNPVCVWSGDVDFYTTETVAEQKETKRGFVVKFESGKSALIVDGAPSGYVWEV